MIDQNVPENQPSVSVPLNPGPVELNPALIKGKKMGRPAGLTVRARCFLELLCAGKTTKEAYKLSGYDGEDENAPYRLRSILKDQLYQMLKSRGMDRTGIMMQLKKGLESPSLEESTGVPLKFDQKLALMKFLAKLTPEKDMLATPKISPFVLNIESAEGVTVTGIGETDETQPDEGV